MTDWSVYVVPLHCITDKLGKITAEYTIPNIRKQIEKLAHEHPNALIAMEVGTHSPWISRLLQKYGNKVIVANVRKLRAIYTNERKSDLLDARMIVKLARLDPELLYPIRHTKIQIIPDNKKEKNSQ